MVRSFDRRLLGAVMMCVCGTGLAATDGTPGATSTGTALVTMQTQALARITDLDDIDLGTWNGTTGLSAADNICVWSTTRGYQITASGSGTAGAFTLTDGTDTIAYSVAWDDAAGAASGTALATGTALTAQASGATSATCQGGTTPTATVLVSVSQTDLEAATFNSAVYSGTLTLVVAPE